MGHEGRLGRRCKPASQRRKRCAGRGGAAQHHRVDSGEVADGGGDLLAGIDEGLEASRDAQGLHPHGTDLDDRAALRQARGLQVDHREGCAGQGNGEVGASSPVSGPAQGAVPDRHQVRDGHPLGEGFGRTLQGRGEKSARESALEGCVYGQQPLRELYEIELTALLPNPVERAGDPALGMQHATA